MSYRLNFVSPAWNEWKKLDPPIQSQLGKKLKKCRALPHIPGNRLYGRDFRGLDNVYPTFRT
uniref:mRNA interferase RelE/StbE n=1 Tax=Candidatus Kentrum sp. DK TaxID=2126562 RepID=A0A450TRA5_9GAMM|nr:MAG: hypothetical protein BECKDK2373B_GA0170837_12881 [Candidatus Kentron sp. DK]